MSSVTGLKHFRNLRGGEIFSLKNSPTVYLLEGVSIFSFSHEEGLKLLKGRGEGINSFLASQPETNQISPSAKLQTIQMSIKARVKSLTILIKIGSSL